MAAYESPTEGGAEPRTERTQLKLGRYEVVRELGKGAMGIVYLAKDPLIGRLVALKTIRASQHAEDEETKEFQQRFVREAQAAGILNHPSIVTVHDIGQDDSTGTSFIAMEYVEGHNLKEVLAQGRPLTFGQIGEIIAQIADGLDFAHSKGIVHRDVKPANIILLDGGRAKITDFGIAKIASSVANLTTTGQFLGTPNYMAPEQVKGAPVDGRSDLFSLGVCMYECLTRKKPFGGDSLTTISYKIVHEPFPPMREINPQIPEEYERVIATCLAKEPAQRYQRGKDFAAAVRAAMRGERSLRPVSEPQPIVAPRDRVKHPTLDVPFPDAAVGAAFGGASTAAATAIDANAAAMTQPEARLRPVPPPQPVPAGVVRATLDRIRAHPLARKPLTPIAFFSISGAALLLLLFAIIGIRGATPTIPDVDTHREEHVRKERQLRLEANKLLADGRVTDAYSKFAELNKLVPSSDYVNATMEKLSRMRQQQEIDRQQIAQAKELFDHGVMLFNSQQYGPAIEIFQQSFHLNPNSEITATYLQLAQQEDDRLRGERTTLLRSVAATPQPRQAPPRLPQAAPAPQAGVQFTTFINSPVNDGTITVKVGADVVARENLYDERGRGLFRRRTPRQVNVTSIIAAKNADVEVWVAVPSQQINEHRTLRGNFQPGTAHRLVVTLDPNSRQLSFQLN